MKRMYKNLSAQLTGFMMKLNYHTQQLRLINYLIILKLLYYQLVFIRKAINRFCVKNKEDKNIVTYIRRHHIYRFGQLRSTIKSNKKVNTFFVAIDGLLLFAQRSTNTSGFSPLVI